MSQKIKKQIRKTMPVFMIFSLLLSTSVAGLVFNLDFKIIKTVNEHFGIEVGLFEAQAQDSASTTVTVRNAPPEFATGPAEVPESASSTPVNAGYQAVWEASATDPESNNFYLIVCGTDSVTPSNGGAPSCGAGVGDTFCVSGATIAGNTATCVDASLADPGAEFDDWFAFVCDDHATEADCSPSSTGSGNSGSPIYINHAPVFSAVITSDDNKDPGGVFTVSATSTDTDTEGGFDENYLYVCESNDWATSTGCGGVEFCSGTSTTDVITCSFATTTPAADGTYNYFAFVKDWHEMPSAVNGRTASYSVNNVAPSVSNVIVNGGDPISVANKDMALEYASSTADLYDANGCSDIVSATSSIYLSTVTGGLNCTADGNNCYQLTTAECSYISGSCVGSDDTTSSFICSTTIEHYAIPTDNSTDNPNDPNTWLAGMTAIDDNGLKGSAAAISGVELITNLAIGVDETEIAYGSIRGGQNSGNVNATSTVVNYGNAPMNTDAEVSDMIKNDLSDWFAADNQEFDLLNFTYGAATYSVASTSNQILDTTTPKPSNLTDVSDEIYWGIGIPGGVSSGDYSGTNTFSATLDNTDW